MAKIGFIGLGIMGRPMAGHLVEGGHELFVHTRRAPPKELIDKGAVACANGKEVGEKAEMIITMVPDTPDVETVLFGAGGVAEGLSKGKIVVDMSSISPLATKDFAKKVNELGCEYLDALVFASKAGADPARVRQALMGGFAASRILEVHGERMIKRNFEPGFRIALHQKDLNLALQGARSLGVSLPNTATCQELFNAASAAGGAAWDHSGMARVLENLAHHEIGQGKASA